MVKYFCDICNEEMPISQAFSVKLNPVTQNRITSISSEYQEICIKCRNRILTQIEIIQKSKSL